MNVGITSSKDGQNWENNSIVTNGYSDYGLQFTIFRGELWGLMVQNAGYKNMMFLNKYSSVTGQWTYFTTVSETARSLGRATCAALDDFFYVCWRGPDDGVYLRWTKKIEQNGQWNEVRVGSQYAKSIVGPAIHAYGGKLYIAAVAEDKYVWYTACDVNGSKQTQWSKVSEWMQSDYSPALGVYDGDLYAFCTEFGGGQVRFWKIDRLTAGTDSINKPSDGLLQGNSIPRATDYGFLASGPSVTTWTGEKNTLVVAYRTNDNLVRYKYHDTQWSNEFTTGERFQTGYEIGVGSWGGLIVMSFGLIYGTYSTSNTNGKILPTMVREQMPPVKTMSEKSGFVEDEEWDCKWKQEEESSWIKKWFCM